MIIPPVLDRHIVHFYNGKPMTHDGVMTATREYIEIGKAIYPREQVERVEVFINGQPRQV